MLSSAPTYPPSDDVTVFWPGPAHSLAPSPFLGSGQYSTRLPLPESPTPSMMFTPPSNHGHSISISSIPSNYLDDETIKDERPHVKGERP